MLTRYFCLLFWNKSAHFLTKNHRGASGFYAIFYWGFFTFLECFSPVDVLMAYHKLSSNNISRADFHFYYQSALLHVSLTHFLDLKTLTTSYAHLHLFIKWILNFVICFVINKKNQHFPLFPTSLDQKHEFTMLLCFAYIIGIFNGLYWLSWITWLIGFSIQSSLLWSNLSSGKSCCSLKPSKFWKKGFHCNLLYFFSVPYYPCFSIWPNLFWWYLKQNTVL